MDVKHLSPDEINTFIGNGCPPSLRKRVTGHIKMCKACRHNVHQYHAMIKAIENFDQFEPGRDFTPMVTRNLPNIYPAQEKPVIEIVSLFLILLPFATVTGLLEYKYKIWTGLIHQLFGTMQSLYTGFLSLEFINDNSNTFFMLFLCLSLFKIFDSAFIKPRKTSRI